MIAALLIVSTAAALFAALAWVNVRQVRVQVRTVAEGVDRLAAALNQQGRQLAALAGVDGEAGPAGGAPGSNAATDRPRPEAIGLPTPPRNGKASVVYHVDGKDHAGEPVLIVTEGEDRADAVLEAKLQGVTPGRVLEVRRL